jgi:benzoyl-CoA reductase subunit B
MSSATKQKVEVKKEKSMVLQKEMIGKLFKDLSTAKETGKKVVYTFVPGNLSELIHAFDLLPVYPEINALQSGMRKKSGDYIREAEKYGHSEDVCTYVKCDIGMMLQGNIGPTGEKIPDPDLLLLSYTGCFTFLKWFESLEDLYPNTEIAMLHTPYQKDGEITEEMTQYMVKQLREEVIPKMEKVSGIKYDEDKLKGILEHSVKTGLGPVTPEGEIEEEQFRLVVEGPPNWTSFREFWKLFYDLGAVIVASSYTKVGGVYDMGFRHDPNRPLESLAEYCMNCYTNLNLPQRIDLLEKCITDYHADGFLVNSIKSCNSFSAGQLLMMRSLEEKLEIPVGFIESDLVDPRYFSYSNIKNRLESFFQMLEQRKLIIEQ